MKKLRTIFSPRNVAIWLTVVLLLITVPEFTKPAMSQTGAIVTMLYVDKADDKIKLCASVLTPKQGTSVEYQNYTGEGKTLAEAVDNVSLTLGKEMSFAHCDVFGIGDTLCDEGVVNVLDFMTRTKRISRNAVMINFVGDIEDFAESVVTISKDKQIKLDQMMQFDKRYILTYDSNVDSFWKGYYSDISLGILPQLEVSEKETDGAIQVELKDKKVYLVNNGSMSAFKHGKRAKVVPADMVQKINIFNLNEFTGVIMVEGVNDHIYNDADVIFNVTESKIGYTPKFENGQPIYEVKLEVTGFIEEIVDKDYDTDRLRKNKDFMSKAFIEKLTQTIEADMKEVVDYCVENNLDFLSVYNNFYHKKHKEFKSYLEEMGEEKYLEGIVLKPSIQIESAL